MTSPLDKPADLHSEIPIQVLLGLFGCFLVLLEGALAQWTIFFAAAPLITLVYIFYMKLFFASRLSLPVIFLIGLFFELMFWEMLGTTATAFYLAGLLTQWRAPFLTHSGFLAIWSHFCLLVVFVTLFKFIIYLLFFLSLPDMSAIFLQIGMTILLFPICYVLLKSAASTGAKIMSGYAK